MITYQYEARCSADGKQQPNTADMDSSDEELNCPPFKRIRIRHSKLAESDSNNDAELVRESESQPHHDKSNHRDLKSGLLAAKYLHTQMKNSATAEAGLANKEDLGTLEGVNIEIVLPYLIPELGMHSVHLHSVLYKR